MPSWLQDAIEIGKASLSPIVAILTVTIAWQQWKTNRAREIRESRGAQLAVYRRVKRLLWEIQYSQTLDRKLYADFTDACAEADFLFGDEVRNWLSELQALATRCVGIQDDLENLSSQASAKVENDLHGELDELTGPLRAANNLLREKFAPYLLRREPARR